ncbi:MAG: serine/threonine-protein phosphatase [Bifidobacteriaceae bacterium]|nr:serine/threonine-protein phosphatase [Aeriscardovia sp.]MBQ1803863.1 serine/threonine-protein phosphatase [Bifidobacteriaceae bacterium]
MELHLSSSLVSDKGYVRKDNQDSGFAGATLAAVADGMGGHAGGATASTIAIRALSHMEHPKAFRHNVEAVCRAAEKSILLAHDAIVGKAAKEKALSGMGTTVDALLLINGYWVLAHIGDSRVYLLQNGKLIRLTHDHSYVQYLIDSSVLTEEEAKIHPQKNVVMRVVGDFNINPLPDICVRKAKPGDRCLLCSDGLSGSLEDSTIEDTLQKIKDEELCAQTLVNMALKAGSSDNITAVVADCLQGSAPRGPALIAGAVEESLESIIATTREKVKIAPPLIEEDSPLKRASDLLREAEEKEEEAERKKAEAAKAKEKKDKKKDSSAFDEPPADTAEIPIVSGKNLNPADPVDAEVLEQYGKEEIREGKKRRKRWKTTVWIFLCFCLATILSVGGYLFYWSQTQYYVGEWEGYVAVYKGVSTDILGIRLSHLEQPTDMSTSSLPPSLRQQLQEGIHASSLSQALQKADDLKAGRA